MSTKRMGLSVKAVLRDASGRTLLLRRSPPSRHFAGDWEWPGGKCDPGEPFDEALVREVAEETGLDVEITGVAGATSFELPEVTVVVLCLEARVTGGALRLSDEHDAAEWVSPADLPRLPLVEPLRSFMLEYARGQSDPAASTRGRDHGTAKPPGDSR